MQRIALITTVCLLSIAGCKLGPAHKHAPIPVTDNRPMDGLRYAHLLQRQGDYLSAVIEYRKVVDCVNSPCEREKARIGAAECLLKVGKYPAAIAVLGVLPLSPTSEMDCHRLAIAGEALLRQHRTEEAECYLEIAVNSVDLEKILCGFNTSDRARMSVLKHIKSETEITRNRQPSTDRSASGADITQCSLQNGANFGDGSPEAIPLGVPIGKHGEQFAASEMSMPCFKKFPGWLPACCANLGCAYLKNDKPQKAAVLYGFAAQVYRIKGDRIASDHAQRMSDDLVTVLRQYTPFKPRPWAKGLPAGKY